MTRRCICLHGHFYQPPRENPWIEEVEVQDSAQPFHDWNERVTAECYGPNGGARIKNDRGQIVDIVNNYDLLSFNFGPTLLSWMERARPEVYQAILEADRRSVAARGHGNAIAQGYSHSILPLCTPRDRQTQIRWGIADFRQRFGRAPEGFWLPETAADRETLRDLAREGIRFTVLSPYQARRVRPLGGVWQNAEGARFDPTRPYRIDLGDGLSIVVFFYDGPIARGLAFGDGLSSGDDLIRRLEQGFEPARGHDEFLSVAIDGETFGHHKKGGEGSLAAALRHIQTEGDWELLNLGQALERFPIEWEVEILEGSSWSCAHGLGRWSTDCGCSAGGPPGWTQKWRAPLRAALDQLRVELDGIYEREAALLFGPKGDGWRLRDRYIELVLDPERTHAREWLDAMAGRPLLPTETTRALRLLEMARHTLLMFTSCGWFFSELSGLETVQILKYAGRAIQLARLVTGVSLEPAFKEALALAPSNIAEMKDGAHIYEVLVKPSIVSLEHVAAHHAIAALFTDLPPTGERFCNRYTFESHRRETIGTATLGVGHIELENWLTGETLSATTCVLHFGGSDFRAGIIPFHDAAKHAELERLLFDEMENLSLTLLVRAIDQTFTGRDFTLRDLFLDERRRLAEMLLRDVLRRYESNDRTVFEENRHLIEFLHEIDSPVPSQLQVAADGAMTQRARQALSHYLDRSFDFATCETELANVAELGKRLRIHFEPNVLRPLFMRVITTNLDRLEKGEPGAAQPLSRFMELAGALQLPLDLFEPQNRIWRLMAGPTGRALDPERIDALARQLSFDASMLRGRGAQA